jgi:hypothetical protein
MTTDIYASGKAAHMSGLDVVNDAIGAALIDTALYTVDIDNDTSLEDVPEAAILATSLVIGKSLIDAEFHADPTVFESVSADDGVDIGAVVVFKNEDTYAACTLLYYDDEAPELPATPDGEDVTVTWGAAVDPENPTNIVYEIS